MASFVVTGEDESFDGPVLGHPFDLSEGHIGAVELAVRATELHVDNHTFPQFADSSKSARDALEVAGGLNWYPIPQLKVVADFARTTFHAGAPFRARDAEDLFLLRIDVTAAPRVRLVPTTACARLLAIAPAKSATTASAPP